MTAIVFEDATTPPMDEAPPHVEEALSGHRCEVCGKPLAYGGRGRPPTKCDEHRKTPSKGTGGGARKNVGNNAALAAQATEALVQVNGLVAMFAKWAQLDMTSETIRNAEEVFREQTYSALLTDPGLCKTILKAGTTSGKVSLLIAYGMLAGAVGPVAYMELQEKKAAREEKRRELEDAAQV